MSNELTDTSIMPFGKYKGTKMANVPAPYLKWLKLQIPVLSVKQTLQQKQLLKYINENEQVLNKESNETTNRLQ